MKLVHLIDYYQPKIGYQEYFLAREHAKMGVITYMLTSDRYFPFPDYQNTYQNLLGSRFLRPVEKKEDGINLIRLKSLEIPGSNLILLIGLKKTLQKINPDLVICHGIYSLTSFFVSKLKNGMNFKLVYDNHAAAFNTDFNKTFPRKLYHYFYKILFAPSILKKADKIFAIGEAEKDFICKDLKLPENKIPIIRLGVDSSLFRFSQKNREKIRAKLKINKDDKVFIFTGKITFNKDVHILIKALEQISKKNTILLLIGDGPEEYLRQLKKSALKTRIIHHQFIENKSLPLYFSAADIAVYPGDFTISISEAISMGLPVILPNWPESAYLDKSGGISRFQRGNPDDLLLKITQLAYNDNLIQKYGRQNRNFAVNNLNWKKIAYKTLKLI